MHRKLHQRSQRNWTTLVYDDGNGLGIGTESVEVPIADSTVVILSLCSAIACR